MANSEIWRLNGVVDVTSAHELHQEARRRFEGGQTCVEVACDGLERIDGSALQLLLALHLALKQAGRELALHDVPETVTKKLELAGAHDLLACCRSSASEKENHS